MNNRLLSFSFSFLFFLNNPLIAQSDNPDSAPMDEELKNEQGFVLKFDPTRFFLFEGKTRDYTRSKINELGLILEQKITGTKSSIEFDFGATLYDYAYQPFSMEENDAADEYYFNLNYSVKSHVGFYSGLGYRYYAKSVLNGLYFSPKFKYRVLKDEVYPAVSPNYESRDERRNEFLFTFNMGYQFWSSENLAFDVYIGGGYRYQTGNYYQCYWSYNPATNSSVLNWIGGTRTWGTPIFNLGLKIGVGKQ